MSSILHGTVYETDPIKAAKNVFLYLPKNIGMCCSNINVTVKKLLYTMQKFNHHIFQPRKKGLWCKLVPRTQASDPYLTSLLW